MCKYESMKVSLKGREGSVVFSENSSMDLVFLGTLPYLPCEKSA